MGSFLLDFNKELKSLVDNEKRCINLCEDMIDINADEAREVLEIGIKFALENELNYAYAYFNYFMARVLHEGDFLEEVLVYTTEAYSTFEEMNLEDELLMTMNLYFLYYIREENMEKCLEWSTTALDLAELIGNQKRISMIKLNLATLYREIGKFNEARDIYIEVEKLAISVSKENRTRLFAGRAVSEAELNNIELAKEYLEMAKGLKEPKDIDIAEIYFADSIILFVEGNLEEAEKKIKIAMDILARLGVKSSLHEQGILLSKIYLKQNKADECIELLTSIEADTKKGKKKQAMLEIHEILEEAYKVNGDFENAYYYSKKVIESKPEALSSCSNREYSMLKKKQEDDEERTYKLLYKQTELLYGIGNKLTSNLNKENIFKIIASEIKNIIKYDIVQIATYSDKKNKYFYDINIEQGEEKSKSNLEVKSGTIAAFCIENKEDILINDIEKEYSKYIVDYDKYNKYRKQESIEGYERRGARSAIFVPITIDKKQIGIVSVQSYNISAYDLKDLTTLKILSTYIGIALENSKLYQLMEYTATHDYLTGLLNRRETINKSECLYNELEVGREKLVVTIMDVDNFKRINDNFGHLTGDKVIEEIGYSIKESLGEEAIVGRYGGEEFIAIFKTNSFIKAEFLGETIRKNIENLNLRDINGDLITTTVSIGMIEVTNKKKKFSEIIGQADKAMYKGKNTGKNRLIYEII